MSTPNYGFTLPPVTQESWHQAFFMDLVTSIAAACQSASQGGTGRQTTVVSFYPTTSFAITYNQSGFLSDGTSRWTTLSAAPYGTCVGTFQVSGANRAAWLALRTTYAIGSVQANGISTTFHAVYWRAMITPGSIQAGGSNSAWHGGVAAIIDDGYRELAAEGFALVPLAAGVYGVTIEMRQFASGSGGDSRFYMNPGHHLVFTMTEVAQ